MSVSGPKDDDREYERLEATFRVRYATVDELVIAYTTDLSRGGLFLVTDQFLPLNAVVRVQLELPDGAGEIPVICRVAYVRDTASAEAAGDDAGMGVEFLDLDGEALQILEHFILNLSSDAQPIAARPERRLKIIVVDDEPAYRERAAELFRARGDQVLLAADGFEALALCLKQPPDVLLCDVQMPRMDGWQLLRMVRARPSLSSVPVVFLTTLATEEERLLGYQLGVDDYICKPYQAAEVQTRVDRLVGRVHRSTRPNVEKKTLRGDLDHVSLASVLSFLAGERKSGELLVIGPSRARLYLRDGQLVRTELSEPVRPDERIFTVLGWKRGVFEFAQQEVDGGDEGRNLTALILEHARRCDEQNR